MSQHFRANMSSHSYVTTKGANNRECSDEASDGRTCDASSLGGDNVLKNPPHKRLAHGPRIS